MIVMNNEHAAQKRTPWIASFLVLSCIAYPIPKGMGSRKKNIHAIKNSPILVKVSMIFFEGEAD